MWPGRSSLTLGGNGIVTRTSPLSTRFEKSLALVAVDTEVVGVHRPEERIVRVLVVGQLRQQRLEASPGDRGRKLERLGWHVAVRARASVASELAEIAVVEGHTTSRDRVAWLAVAIEPCGAVSLRDDVPRTGP